MQNNNGFTLIELMIVVAILGVISAIGIPQYMGYSDNSKITVVKNGLRAVFMQQQDYYRTNNAYYSTGGTCSDSTAGINTNLFSGNNILNNDDGFYYCITQTSVDDFTAQAVEEVSGGRTFTITENNVTNF